MEVSTDSEAHWMSSYKRNLSKAVKQKVKVTGTCSFQDITERQISKDRRIFLKFFLGSSFGLLLEKRYGAESDVLSSLLNNTTVIHIKVYL